MMIIWGIHITHAHFANGWNPFSVFPKNINYLKECHAVNLNSRLSSLDTSFWEDGSPHEHTHKRIRKEFGNYRNKESARRMLTNNNVIVLDAVIIAIIIMTIVCIPLVQLSRFFSSMSIHAGAWTVDVVWTSKVVYFENVHLSLAHTLWLCVYVYVP